MNKRQLLGNGRTLATLRFWVVMLRATGIRQRIPAVVVINELGYLPFARSGGQLLSHLVSKRYERTSVIIITSWRSASGRACSAIPR